MKEQIKQILEEEQITLSGVVSLENCIIRKPYLLERFGITSGSVFLFAIPYYSEFCDTEGRNISAYAVSEDYHLYVSELSGRILPRLSLIFPDNRFAIFSDHSPIDEREAAIRCGIGFLGDNGLVINTEFSSFFFLAEIVTDAILEEDAPTDALCLHCKKCISACPMKLDSSAECLSAITQKKGYITDFEHSLMKKHNTFWGCDICQNICPYTERAKKFGTLYTSVPFFRRNSLPVLDEETVAGLSEEEFTRRAYSWRGKETVLRNLKTK